MSDLISRQAVLDILEKEKSLRCGYDVDIAIFSIEKDIRELPTAYDVDAVVAELEEKSEYYQVYGDCEGNSWRAYDNAMDIVKAGGNNGR